VPENQGIQFTQRHGALDVQKHIEYWRTGGEQDFDAASALLQTGHFRHALFCAHLALEKLLKAHVTRQTGETPPRIHDLLRLADMARLSLHDTQRAFLAEFSVYQLEGRYPDAEQVPLDSGRANKQISRAEEMLGWLTERL